MVGSGLIRLVDDWIWENTRSRKTCQSALGRRGQIQVRNRAPQGPRCRCTHTLSKYGKIAPAFSILWGSWISYNFFTLYRFMFNLKMISFDRGGKYKYCFFWGSLLLAVPSSPLRYGAGLWPKENIKSCIIDFSDLRGPFAEWSLILFKLLQCLSPREMCLIFPISSKHLLINWKGKKKRIVGEGWWGSKRVGPLTDPRAGCNPLQISFQITTMARRGGEEEKP